jgi:hypothetical protein
MTKPRLSSERRRLSLALGFWGSTQTTSTPAGRKNSTSQSSVVSRALNVRRRQSTKATSYWPAGRPQFAVAAARTKPRRCSSNIISTALEPATMIRCCSRQHASAMIGSMIRSPGGMDREGVMMSPFWTNYCRPRRGLERLIVYQASRESWARVLNVEGSLSRGLSAGVEFKKSREPRISVWRDDLRTPN